MKSKTHNPSAREFIEKLATSGHYQFTSVDARAALGVSNDAVKLALNRLRRQGHLASPVRGFYVILPPEYRPLGCLPADQFIPALMAHQEKPYYAGLLTAAQYYGAAHHRPQAFQVLLEKSQKPIECGKVRVGFVARKRLQEVKTRKFNTPRGQIQVSTPEATAVDLAGYPHHVGGLDGVATILAELVEEIDGTLLPDAAATAPLVWAQRLGYLLDLSGGGTKSKLLMDYVRQNAQAFTPLIPGQYLETDERVADWKLIVNSRVEPDL